MNMSRDAVIAARDDWDVARRGGPGPWKPRGRATPPSNFNCQDSYSLESYFGARGYEQALRRALGR